MAAAQAWALEECKEMNTSMNHSFTSVVWLYPGEAAWYFVSLPKDLSEKLSTMYEMQKRGFGSLPVMVAIGKTTWKTSIFPDKKSGQYMLPLKAEVRKKEGIAVDKEITVVIEVCL